MTEYLITPMSADSGINSHSTVAGSEDVYNCTAHGNNPVSPSETYSTGFKDSRSTSRSARKSDAVPYKPTVPYAQLISQAIDSKPDHKITLNEIYNFAMHTYEYFKSAGNGWKNSIRHNLSLNKNFIRVARPLNEKGKGAYWTFASQSSAGERKAPAKHKLTPQYSSTETLTHQDVPSPSFFDLPFLMSTDDSYASFDLSQLSHDSFTTFLDNDKQSPFIPPFLQKTYFQDAHSASAAEKSPFLEKLWVPEVTPITFECQGFPSTFYPVYDCPSSVVGTLHTEDDFSSFSGLDWINQDQCDD